MTLNDLLKRIDIKRDKNKMFIFSDGVGWNNVNFEIKENEIIITENKTRPFLND